MAAFTPVAGDLQGDIPKYTDITPISYQVQRRLRIGCEQPIALK